MLVLEQRALLPSGSPSWECNVFQDSMCMHDFKTTKNVKKENVGSQMVKSKAKLLFHSVKPVCLFFFNSLTWNFPASGTEAAWVSG